MRILQVQSRSRVPGGADDAMNAEAQILTDAGHHVEQMWHEPVGDSVGVRQAADVVWNRAAGRAIGARVRRLGADIVHVHSAYPLMSPVVFRAAARAGAATVATMHNYRLACVVATCLRDGHLCFDCVGRRFKTPGVRYRCYHDSRPASAAMALSLATHRITGTFRSAVHRYLVFSEFARDLFVRDGYPSERFGLMANAVTDPGPVSARSGPFGYAAFVGRFAPEKGIDTLLTAWQGLDIPLMIAGDGPGTPQVEDAARRHSRIEYVGWLDADARTRLLAGADALIFPSRWLEGQPLVLLQAMAAGVPVVCSDIPNIEETAVAQGGGVSFAVGDPGALADAVRDLAADPERARRLGAVGRDVYLDRHTPARVGEVLLEHYRQAMAARDGGRSRR